MTEDPGFTQEHQGEHDVHKLLTPEMQQRVIQLKKRLEEFADHLDTLCCNLEEINAAIFKAQEIAECLLDDDPFRAWNVIKRDRAAEDGDWETEDPD